MSPMSLDAAGNGSDVSDEKRTVMKKNVNLGMEVQHAMQSIMPGT